MAGDKPSRRREIGTDGLWTLCLSCGLITVTLGVSWLLVTWRVWRMAVNATTDVEPLDWIVVLGNRLLGSAISLYFSARLRRAEILYRKNPEARILIHGGRTSEGPFTEAGQGKSFLLQRGVPKAAIHTEDSSLYTLENLQNAKRLLPHTPEKPHVLVTSRHHLARCHTLAQGMQLPHVLCAAEDRWQWRPALLKRLWVEGFYLHWYWVGRIWSTLTRNRKSLARIT